MLDGEIQGSKSALFGDVFVRTMSEDNFHKYMFRAAANTNTEGGSAAIIMNELGVKRICTMLLDYSYGHDLMKGFKKHLERLDPEAEIVTEVWPALNVSDYTPYITEVMNSDSDDSKAAVATKGDSSSSAPGPV